MEVDCFGLMPLLCQVVLAAFLYNKDLASVVMDVPRSSSPKVKEEEGL